ncbi:MAG: hypothetical protein ACP5T1_06390 [Thermoplasmata archaeon]
MDSEIRPADNLTRMEIAVEVKNALPISQTPLNTANMDMFGESPERQAKTINIANPTNSVLLLSYLVEKYSDINIESDITAI